MDYAFILLIVAAIATGVVAAVVNTWSLRARTYSVEERLGLVEGTLVREVKTRAAQERWKKPTADEAAIEAALTTPQPSQPQKPKNWWLDPSLAKRPHAS
jgi:hypothetical protein